MYRSGQIDLIRSSGSIHLIRLNCMNHMNLSEPYKLGKCKPQIWAFLSYGKELLIPLVLDEAYIPPMI